MSASNSRLKVMLAFAVVAACALVALELTAFRPQAKHTRFSVNEFVAVAMEYQGDDTLIGVNTYGPTGKEFSCERSAAAATAQASDVIPHGHTLVSTCLHIAFGGPLPRGAVAILPEVKDTFEYITVGVEYTGAGEFVGARPLNSAPNAKTCGQEAHDVLNSNYNDGHIKAGNSLLLYCMPVPKIHQDSADSGGVV